MIRVKPGGGTSVTVIDLDVKPIDRLHKWALLDAKIVKAYEGLRSASTAGRFEQTMCW